MSQTNSGGGEKCVTIGVRQNGDVISGELVP